jgi:hypothetical protein
MIFTQYTSLLDEFLASGITLGPRNSQWLEVDDHGGYIRTYLRKKEMYLHGEKHTALVLANVIIWPEKQGTGVKILKLLQDNNPFDLFVVENIQNEQFYLHLKKAGLEDIPHVYAGEGNTSLYVWNENADRTRNV